MNIKNANIKNYLYYAIIIFVCVRKRLRNNIFKNLIIIRLLIRSKKKNIIAFPIAIIANHFPSD